LFLKIYLYYYLSYFVAVYCSITQYFLSLIIFIILFFDFSSFCMEKKTYQHTDNVEIMLGESKYAFVLAAAAAIAVAVAAAVVSLCRFIPSFIFSFLLFSSLSFVIFISEGGGGEGTVVSVVGE